MRTMTATNTSDTTAITAVSVLFTVWFARWQVTPGSSSRRRDAAQGGT
jgi:hypothetical protein